MRKKNENHFTPTRMSGIKNGQKWQRLVKVWWNLWPFHTADGKARQLFWNGVKIVPFVQCELTMRLSHFNPRYTEGLHRVHGKHIEWNSCGWISKCFTPMSSYLIQLFHKFSHVSSSVEEEWKHTSTQKCPQGRLQCPGSCSFSASDIYLLPGFSWTLSIYRLTFRLPKWLLKPAASIYSHLLSPPHQVSLLWH